MLAVIYCIIYTTISHRVKKSKIGILFLNRFQAPGHTKPNETGKEERNMNCHANKSIECTVQSCANHCGNENYCSLDRILVGTHECNPTMDQCTDCMSFRKK